MFSVGIKASNGDFSEVFVFGEKSILFELEENHILINHSCRQGYCGSCLVRLLSGEVRHKEALIPLLEGEILACCATPTTDIVIALSN
jgi:ferredoxin